MKSIVAFGLSLLGLFTVFFSAFVLLYFSPFFSVFLFFFFFAAFVLLQQLKLNQL